LKKQTKTISNNHSAHGMLLPARALSIFRAISARAGRFFTGVATEYRSFDERQKGFETEFSRGQQLTFRITPEATACLACGLQNDWA
jgi:hypothetical protein